jgi:hypothetical protein
MTKAQIFISHSARDDEIDDAVPLDGETDPRRRRLKYAKALRDAIVAGLGDDYEVLLDRQLLDPGDRWRAKLLRWLGCCHGAVILLSEDSIQSKWVLQEATIATWRKWLRDDFMLVPVIVGNLQMDQVEKAGFGPLQVAEFQGAKLGGSAALTRANAEQLAQQVVARLDALKGSGDGDNDMQRWIEDVAARLQGIPETILHRTCTALQIDAADWAHFPDREATVAHRLLHASLHAAGDALEAIKGALPHEEFAELAAKVLPIWVREEAASVLACRVQAAGAGASPWFALNTDRPATARDYAQRAYCCPNWWSNRCLDFDEPLGEGQEAEALVELERKLRAQLRILDTDPPDKLAQRLARRPFFVVIGHEVAATPELQRLVAQSETLRAITCLLLAGRRFERLPPADARVVRLRPELQDRDEVDASAEQDFIRDLAS